MLDISVDRTRPACKAPQDDGAGDFPELAELESRRMRPRSMRGRTQRLRAAGRVRRAVVVPQLRAARRPAAASGAQKSRVGGANSVVQRSKEEKMKAALASIGIFADYACAPGADFLTHSDPSFTGSDAEAIQSIFDELGVAPGGCYRVVPTVLLEHDERRKLIHELNSRCGHELDYKVPLTGEELAQLVGAAIVEQLASVMPQGFDQIYLRRCSAHGKHIRFHVDEALWTLQVPLNEPEEYQ